MNLNARQAGCCCDKLLCKKKDETLFANMDMPVIVEFCGNLFFANILDVRFLLFRMFAGVYSAFIIIWNFVRFYEQGYAKWWPIYFTQWFSVLTTIYFILVSTIHHRFAKLIKKHEQLAIANQSPDSTNSGLNHRVRNANNKHWSPNGDLSIEPPAYSKLHVILPSSPSEDEVSDVRLLIKLSKLCHVLFYLILSPELGIVLIYWTTVFPSAKEWDAAELANDIHMHGVYLLLILIEFFGSTVALRYGGIVWPFGFGIVFGLWTLLHYALGGEDFKGNRYIYPLMNWGEYPTSACGLWVFAIVMLPGIHWGFVKLKGRLLTKWIEKFTAKRKQSLNHNGTTKESANASFQAKMNEKLTDNHHSNTNTPKMNTNDETNKDGNNDRNGNGNKAPEIEIAKQDSDGKQNSTLEQSPVTVASTTDDGLRYT